MTEFDSQRRPSTAPRRQLIVNADDLGMCEATNRGIAIAFQAGGLSSASLMVTTAGFLGGVEVVHRLELPVGLHFALTSGRPVLPVNQVDLLVDRRGRFAHGFFGLWRLLASRRAEAALRQIEAELGAQWQKLARAGIEPTHLDSHQHVHMLPGLFPVLAEFARPRGLALRVSQGPWTAEKSGSAWKAWLAHPVQMARWTLLDTFSRRLSPYDAAVRRTDHCFGILNSGHMTERAVLALIERLPEGSSELLIHPASEGIPHLDADLSPADRRFVASPHRQQELAALLSPRFRETLDRRRVELIEQPKAASRVA